MKNKTLIAFLGSILCIIGHYVFDPDIYILVVLGNILIAIGYYREKFELIAFIVFSLTVFFSAIFTLIAVLEQVCNI